MSSRFRVSCAACGLWQDLPAVVPSAEDLAVAAAAGATLTPVATTRSGTCPNCGHDKTTAELIGP